MKTAYLNCSSGIAGDMLLSAFIHAGVSYRALERELKKGLRISGWKLSVKTIERKHIRGRNLVVKGDRHFESPNEMRQLVACGAITVNAKKRALAILDRIIEAESRVHGVPKNKVHFHELNSIDTLVDVVGSCLALEMAQVSSVFCSPINVGRPAPAATEMLKKYAIPVYATSAVHELATPTGIAIASVVAQGFGPMPPLTVERSGYGAGSAEFDDHPNMLQILIGAGPDRPGQGYRMDELIMLSTNIDDMDPRIYPHVMDQLLAGGANDAWLTQVLMKKGRPGIVLSVLCSRESEARMVEIIFRETTTLGIRRETISRHVLGRKMGHGIKIACLPGGRRRIKSEFNDTKKMAAKSRIPLVHLLV